MPGTRAPSTKEEPWRLSSLRGKKKNDLEKQRNQAKVPPLMKTDFSTVALLIYLSNRHFFVVESCPLHCGMYSCHLWSTAIPLHNTDKKNQGLLMLPNGLGEEARRTKLSWLKTTGFETSMTGN